MENKIIVIYKKTLRNPSRSFQWFLIKAIR